MIPSSMVPYVAVPALILSLSPALRVGGIPAAPRAPIAGHERAALVAAAEPSLGSLRAGDSTTNVALQGAERTELVRAQAAAAELGARRAGDLHLDDHDLTIIGIVLAVVLIIAVLA